MAEIAPFLNITDRFAGTNFESCLDAHHCIRYLFNLRDKEQVADKFTPPFALDSVDVKLSINVNIFKHNIKLSRVTVC